MELTDQNNSKPSHSLVGIPFVIELANDASHDEVGNSHGDTTVDGELPAADLVEVEEGGNSGNLTKMLC
jgi:hypothetical protein